MPSLQWIGKDKVVNHSLDVAYRPLQHQYSYGKENPGSSGNKIIHGDNLEALKSLLPEYEGKIKCIYIDPPYNTGNEHWIYNDNVNDPKLKKWLGRVVGREAEDLTRHDKWLCMMYPRLALLHKLLAEDGVIFISIDDNELTHLRLLMNEVFGNGNFRNHIVVRRGAKSVQAQFDTIDKLGIACEFLVSYTKSTAFRLPQFYFELDEEKPGAWNNHWRGTDRPTMRYELLGINPEKGQWRWSRERSITAIENYKHCLQDLQITGEEPSQDAIDDWYEKNAMMKNQEIDLLRLSKNDKPEHYVAPTNRKFGHNLWTDLLVNGTSEFNKYAKETFDNPKNPKIIERILSWIGDKDSIVLDSFAGSGTTAHAVLNLNKQDGGNRKFILIEMEDYASSITAERVKRVMDSYVNKEGAGNSFGYYELGPEMFTEDGEINTDLSSDHLRKYVYYSETKGLLEPAGGMDNQFFLNRYNDIAYYFFYEPGQTTTLNHEFLSTITTRASQYVIYADNCLLSEAFMAKHKIIFKKTSRDITRF